MNISNEPKAKRVFQIVVIVSVAIVSSVLISLLNNLTPTYFSNIHYPYPIYVSYWLCGASIAFWIYEENETLNMFILAQFFIVLFLVVNTLIVFKIPDPYHLCIVISGGYILIKKHIINLKKFLLFKILCFLWTLLLLSIGEYAPYFLTKDILIILSALSILIATYCINFLIVYIFYRRQSKVT